MFSKISVAKVSEEDLKDIPVADVNDLKAYLVMIEKFDAAVKIMEDVQSRDPPENKVTPEVTKQIFGDLLEVYPNAMHILKKFSPNGANDKHAEEVMKIVKNLQSSNLKAEDPETVAQVDATVAHIKQMEHVSFIIDPEAITHQG